MERRTSFEAALDKRANVKDCEEKGLIADSMEVRMALIEQVRTGELTPEQMQAKLKKIKAQAKKNGMLTREQAFSRG
jgi:hypothetical protein